MNPQMMPRRQWSEAPQLADIAARCHPDRMDLRHLRYFVAAAEEENFTRAAQQLYVAAPALSRRIRDLEAELGVALFERRKKRVFLTDAGGIFLDDTRRILEDLAQACRRTRRAAQVCGDGLAIGIHAVSMRHAIVAATLNEFLLTAGDVELKLETMLPIVLVAAIEAADVDAAFVNRGHRPSNGRPLEHIEVARDDYVLALPHTHRLAATDEIRLVDLAREKFLWMPRDLSPVMHDQLLAACAKKGLIPNIVQHASAEARIHLVAAGAGVSFVLSPLWQPWPADVVTRKIVDLSLPQLLDFVWSADNRSPALQRLIEIVRRLKAGGRPGS